MSWYVEYLLLNRDGIRTKQDIESDEFNDLLLVERELKRLVENKAIGAEEFILFRSFLSYPINNKIDYRTISSVFRKVSRRLSMCLGGIFTDEGYIEYIKNKYNLQNNQAYLLAQFMQSGYRHELLSKPYKEKKQNVKKSS